MQHPGHSYVPFALAERTLLLGMDKLNKSKIGRYHTARRVVWRISNENYFQLLE
jgi:hypothetical protein